ncbi:hypothetical protein ACLK19_11240 [Escherichia coli]
MFFKVLRAGLETNSPHHFKDTLRIASARIFNLQSKKTSWIVGKEHYDLGNDLLSRMLNPSSNIPALTGKMPIIWNLPGRRSWK